VRLSVLPPQLEVDGIHVDLQYSRLNVAFGKSVLIANPHPPRIPISAFIAFSSARRVRVAVRPVRPAHLPVSNPACACAPRHHRIAEFSSLASRSVFARRWFDLNQFADKDARKLDLQSAMTLNG
jgi:hypothetical protein